MTTEEKLQSIADKIETAVNGTVSLPEVHNVLVLARQEIHDLDLELFGEEEKKPEESSETTGEVAGATDTQTGSESGTVTEGEGQNSAE